MNEVIKVLTFRSKGFDKNLIAILFWINVSRVFIWIFKYMS